MTSNSNGKGTGRQKIKMKKRENESNRLVTFSKSRNGVFKKAHELSILTGAEVAAVVFSPSGKVYSFGHPTAEVVIDKFSTRISPALTLTQQVVQAQRSAIVVETNTNLIWVKEMIEYERNRGEALDKVLAASPNNHWGGGDVDEKNLWQLQQSVIALKSTKAELDREIHARVSAQQNSRAPGRIYNSYGGETGLLSLGSDEYGGGSSVLPGSTGLSFYGNVGDWSSSSQRNLCDSGGLFVNSLSSFVSVGLPNTFEASSSIVSISGGVWSFNDGPSPIGGAGVPFVGGSSSFVGGGTGHDGFLNTEGASSSWVGVGGGGSYATVPEGNGSMPPNGFGGVFLA